MWNINFLLDFCILLLFSVNFGVLYKKIQGISGEMSRYMYSFNEISKRKRYKLKNIIYTKKNTHLALFTRKLQKIIKNYVKD